MLAAGCIRNTVMTLLLCCTWITPFSNGFAASSIPELIQAAEAKSGLAVCIGADEPKLILDLHAAGFRVVHALDADPATVAKTRNALTRSKAYGSVFTERFDGQHLPHVDNLVNFLIVKSPWKPAADEIVRVLAPGGVFAMREGFGRTNLTFRSVGEWRIFRKPVPKDTDSWTHYLHGPDGNPVAKDDQVATPRQLQWIADPKYARHHEHMASMSALISSNGRVFAVCDEGPMRAMLHPPRWMLSARDAYNGLLLWKRHIKEWYPHLHRLKSGPASLPRRLVANGERVYVTLGMDVPVSVLNAATGETIRKLKGTEGAQELVFSGGTLFVTRGDKSATHLTAVDPETGTVQWDRKVSVISMTLAADAHRVVFFNGKQVVSLNRKDGSGEWTSKQLSERSQAHWQSGSTPRLILSKDAVVVAPARSMMALSCKDGRALWNAPHPESGYKSPKDLFVIDGLVWYGDTAGADDSGRFDGRDLLTGKVKSSFLPDKDIVWLSHHRCHFSKATRKYIIPGRMGVEFVDLKEEKWQENHWVRGGCIYGIMPCNGMIYVPPHACACYFEMRMNGFAAYSPKTHRLDSTAPQRRLEKGPAYEWGKDVKSAVTGDDWPVFRYDAARSGSSPTKVGSAVKRRWSAQIGGNLTQPVVANGTLYVASIDRHALHALDEKTGKPRWVFHAGGRIDSPPSIYRGRVLFGSRDGWVYCLRHTDGALSWRYRASPADVRIAARGQLESAWPVHGSVLIESGEVHFIAGRNMFLDGGLRYTRLNADTGERISENVMDRNDPLKGGSIQKYDSWLDMTTTAPDVLSCDGTNIYMRSLPFDKQGKRRRITHLADEKEPPHLFSPTGFLDGTWFHRTYWTYGRSFPGGWIGHLNAGRYNPSGRLLVMDENFVFGFGRKPDYYRWVTSLEYRLFAVDRKAFKPRDIYAYDKFKARQVKKFPTMKIDKGLGLPSGPRPKKLPKAYDCAWQVADVPILVRAMVSAKNLLFIAGPKDVSNEGQLSYQNALEEYGRFKAHLAQQDEIWESAQQGAVHAITKRDGRTVAKFNMDGLPVFDGMIAANGCLYVAMQDGRILCLADESNAP